MLIKNSQQDVKIEIPISIKNVGLKLSGGADSAIVGYMLSKYVITERPDIKIVPITVVQIGKSFQLIFAKRIIDFYKNYFGDIFLEHRTATSTTPENYVPAQEQLMSFLYKTKIIDFHFSGITLNPPENAISEYILSLGGTEPPDRLRGRNIESSLKANNPLINLDKKGVAELYHTLGIIDTLFPLTRSCSIFTDDFSKHCEQCWFCSERFYGFGRYV
jgi:hypothetical protein